MAEVIKTDKVTSDEIVKVLKWSLMPLYYYAPVPVGYSDNYADMIRLQNESGAVAGVSRSSSPE